MKVNAYVAPAPGAPLQPSSIDRRAVGPNDVLIAINYVGICHSDVHTVRGEWGPQPFPLVPGHEIVGVVEATGATVTKHQPGDRVGVGCMVNSCRECRMCSQGDEQFCENGMVATYAGRDMDGTTTQGGYSTHIVVDAEFVLKIPESLDAASAAPLLCAGVTTYAPLVHHGVGPGSRVAIAGIGGLGHVAIKFARALGAEVTALSRTPQKEKDAARLGAHHFHATGDPGTFASLTNSFDLVLNTASARLDLDSYLGLLATDGKVVCVGAPPEPSAVNLFSLVLGRKSIAGSMIGGIAQTQQMLDFSAVHGIGADVEIIAANDINAAYERVLASDVRYRFVVDAATL